MGIRRALVVPPLAIALLAGVAARPENFGGGPAFARAGSGRPDGNRKASRARVVRIERARSMSHDRLRACQITYSPGDPSASVGMCWGAGVAEGEIATVLDPTGIHGTVRVTSATEPNCANGYYNSWTFRYEVIDGNLDPTMSGYVSMYGVFDLALSASARAIEQGQVSVPNATGNENPLVAVDSDGVDGEDLIVSYYSCDEVGDVIQGSPYYGGGTAPYALCLDYWMLDGTTWERSRRDLVPTCATP